ncbi:aspartate carbamoyltransferase (catalytic subunit) [Candidatus Magnetoovum chiemensis]|nr:aspartate carbamoyltransferase (catalytic subunit) [Candidatus Magnetoovum chiemensis]
MEKDLVSIQDLSREDIELILNTASSFKEVLGRDIKKVPTLRGKTAVNLFFEPSTRTKTSFELAEKRLSTDVISLSIQASSVVKGESLVDTIKTIEAYGINYIIIRHSSSGVAHFISQISEASVINAGDGINEHPTQALIDAFTMLEKKGSLDNLTVAIVGDIAHSRVARSNIYCLKKLGVNIRLISPYTFLPKGIEKFGVDVYTDILEGVSHCDVVMALRIQSERIGTGYFPSYDEYFRFWGLTKNRIKHAKPDVLIMHPGPMNRGVEIDSEVADGPNSVITDQVVNGVAVRMAILYLLKGG